jgi:hypothetical protein
VTEAKLPVLWRSFLQAPRSLPVVALRTNRISDIGSGSTEDSRPRSAKRAPRRREMYMEQGQAEYRSVALDDGVSDKENMQ